MASDMPLPIPPRTPTPPPDVQGDSHAIGLGLDDQLAPEDSFGGFDPNALSPMFGGFPSARYGTLALNDSQSQRGTPSTVFSPASATFPLTPTSAISATSENEAPSSNGSKNTPNPNPFNFQSVQYMPSRPQANKPVRMPLSYIQMD
jgi:hypothetical protein